MIIGIGTDLTDIGRMEHACAKETFRRYVFTDQEQKYARGRAESLAAIFAAKEAAAKALGTGFAGFTPKDIEVYHLKEGKPCLRFWNGAEEKRKEIGAQTCFLSLSHEKNQALAFVVLEGGERNAVSEQSGDHA